MSKVFINYRTGDDSFAAVHLDQHLCERLGAENVFRDSRSIPVGKDFTRRLWAELSGCSLLIVVIGSQWLGKRLHDPADYVRREIAFALERDIDVMPVLVGGVPMPADEDLPEDIRPLRLRQYRRIHARSADTDVPAVVAAVETALGGSPPATRDVPLDHQRGDLLMGDKVMGDKVMGDKVMGDKVAGNKIVWQK
jgi:TIR domain-containing protein